MKHAMLGFCLLLGMLLSTNSSYAQSNYNHITVTGWGGTEISDNAMEINDGSRMILIYMHLHGAMEGCTENEYSWSISGPYTANFVHGKYSHSADVIFDGPGNYTVTATVKNKYGQFVAYYFVYCN